MDRVDDVVRPGDIRDLLILVCQRLGEAGEAGVELFRVLRLGDDQHDPVIRKRNRLDHDRDIFRREAKLSVSLLHHIPKQFSRFFRPVGELMEADLALRKVCHRERAADLVVVQFLYLHKSPHTLFYRDYIVILSPCKQARNTIY